MTKWEYRVAQTALQISSGTRDGVSAETVACALGKEGWELVDVVGAASSSVITMFFKRQLKRAYNMKNRGKRGKK